MSLIPNYVPSQYKTVNISLSVRNAQKALDFYNMAFGAETVMKLTDPNGVIVHAEFKIADTIIMLSEEDHRYNYAPETLGGSSVVIHLYVGDVEGMFEDAIRAGAKEVIPVKEQFYGDRAGRLRDPFGHVWVLATHMEDVTPIQMQKRFYDLYHQSH